MTQDSILNFREYGGLPCFSLLEQNDTNQLLIDISRDQALSRSQRITKLAKSHA